MPVTVRDLGEPKGPPDLRYLFAGVSALALLCLAAWSLLAMPAPPPGGVTTPAPSLGGVPTAAMLATPAPTPTARVAETAPPATAVAVSTPNCPTASLPPADASPAWVARAAGCPHLAWATVAGRRQWVVRTGLLSDEIYQQLPEIQP